MINGVTTTAGEIAFQSPRLVIDWQIDLVPNEELTWFEKHGLLQEVVIQTERPDTENAGYYKQTLDSKKSSDFATLIIDNEGDHLRYVVLSKAESDPSVGFWNDS